MTSMKMNVVIAIVLGIVISGITALINVTPSGLVGATWYGWPMPWLYNLVTYPPATNYNFVNLAIDVVVWFIVVFVILTLVSMVGKKKPAKAAPMPNQPPAAKM